MQSSVQLSIEGHILALRGRNVILDAHLAQLYGVETKALKRAVRRNANRFPDDFMFELTREEYTSLRRHFGTLGRGRHSKYSVFAFTEEGIAMLSSVLRSDRAIRANVEIMRAFVRLRRLLASHADLARKLHQLEQRYDDKFRVVFEAIRQLMAPPDPPNRRIGFGAE